MSNENKPVGQNEPQSDPANESSVGGTRYVIGLNDEQLPDRLKQVLASVPAGMGTRVRIWATQIWGGMIPTGDDGEMPVDEWIDAVLNAALGGSDERWSSMPPFQVVDQEARRAEWLKEQAEAQAAAQEALWARIAQHVQKTGELVQSLLGKGISETAAVAIVEKRMAETIKQDPAPVDYSPPFAHAGVQLPLNGGGVWKDGPRISRIAPHFGATILGPNY